MRKDRVQYKVPQNIDLEDKIVGPFTMKQFLYLVVGGFILYGWYSYSNQFVNQMPIFLALAIPVGLLFFCLAIVKINDRPFEIFLLNCFRFLLSPKQLKWITGYSPESVIMLDPLEAKQKKEEVKTESDLDDLAKSLEKQTSELKSQNQPTPLKTSAGAKPSNLNLSISDIGSAADKQQQAQAAPVKSAPGAKKGILSIFK